MDIISHRDLTVWQKSIDLVVQIYKFTDEFPKSELYGLTSQIKRCAVSIPSNIAEGRRRSTKKDFRQFLIIAYGSASEMETQLEIAKRLKFINEENFQSASNQLLEILKMLNKMITNLGLTNS